MFIGVNYIIICICIDLFQDLLFHNFVRDQCQDENPVIIYSFLKLRGEKKSVLFHLKPSLLQMCGSDPWSAL